MKKIKRNLSKKKKSQATKISREVDKGSVTGDKNLDIIFNKALSLHQSGRYSEAEILYRNILDKVPSSVVTLCNLALAVWKLGKFKETEKLFGDALLLNPGDSQIHIFLGNLLFELNRLGEAESSYITATRMAPSNAAAFNNLGLVLQRLGKLNESGEAFNTAININPDYFEALNNLGSIKLESGKPQEAAILYEKAISARPGYVDAMANLGLCYKELGLYVESEKMFRQAIKLQPNNPDLFNNLGMLLADQGKYEETEQFYRQALDTNPEHYITLINLGEILEKTNRIEESKSQILKALKINPKALGAKRLLSTLLRREGKFEEALEKLKGINTVQCNLENSAAIHHELGMIHERLDHHEKAYYHFAKAQKLQTDTAEGKRADKNRFLTSLDRVQNYFSKELIKLWETENCNAQAEQPVFIVGFPRSGTTLLDQLLNSHPALSVAEETNALAGVIKKIAGSNSAYPEALTKISPPDINYFREVYYAGLKKHLGNRENWESTQLVDKFPLHIVHLGLIYRLFPEAKIIVAIRHPCDVCLSNFMQLFKLNDAMANFSTLQDAATCYVKVMNLWLHYRNILPLQFHIIRYEDLVENFEAEVRNLLSFLDVQWDERVTKFYEHAKKKDKIYTPSYQQVAQPIYQRSVYRWQNYKLHFKGIIDTLAPYIAEFGYNEHVS